ncbi:MAG: hypothetical protein R3B70_31635 [Polyangiaceae bacterium]
MIASPAVAWAGPTPADDELNRKVTEQFEEASREMDRSDFASACPRLERVVEMRPDAGGARMALAECYEGLGKLATAAARYEDARKVAVEEGKQERAALAAGKVRSLSERAASVAFEVPPALTAIQGWTVLLGASTLDKARLAQPVLVDKGQHEVTVSAPGHETAHLTLRVERDGEKTTLALPALVPAALPKSAPPPVEEPRREPRSGPSRILPISAGAVGLASMVTGAVLVGLASGVPGAIEAELPRDAQDRSACANAPQPREPAECADLRSRAEAGSLMGNAGIGLLVAGGLLAGGAAAYLLIPRKPATNVSLRVLPSAGPTGGGAVLSGTF